MLGILNYNKQRECGIPAIANDSFFGVTLFHDHKVKSDALLIKYTFIWYYTENWMYCGPFCPYKNNSKFASPKTIFYIWIKMNLLH